MLPWDYVVMRIVTGVLKTGNQTKRMIIGKTVVKTLFVAAAAAWGSSVAQASYDYTILGDGGLLGGFSVSVDGNTESGILVGGIDVKANPNGSGVTGFQQFTTVCVDLNGRIYLGSTYTFDEVGFSGQSGLNPLWGQPTGNSSAAYQAINNAAYLYSTFHPTSATDWAALQLAVWKVVYDTEATGAVDWNVATERFTVGTDAGSGAWAEAVTLIGTLPRNMNYTGYLLKPTDVNAQELLIGITPVPETGTIIAGTLLLLPLGASTLKILRKGRSA